MRSSLKRKITATTCLSLLFLPATGIQAESSNGTAPPFQLLNWDGREVSLESLRGKVPIIVFTYAKCLYGCPLVTYYLKELDKEIGSPSDLRIIHISVNPADDTEQEVRNHFKKFGIDPELDPRWFFLTGPNEEIESVLADYGIKVEKRLLADGFLIDHTIRVHVLDREGEFVESFDTYLWEEERMKNALHRSIPAQ